MAPANDATLWPFGSYGRGEQTPLSMVVALFPLGVAQVTGELLGMFANGKYLLVSHVVFLLMMVAAVLALPRRGLAVVACTLLALTYASRLEAVYQPEYDARAVERYVASVQTPSTRVLLLGPTPAAMPSGQSWLDVRAFVPYDFRAGHYRLADRQTLDAALDGFPRVIYVRVYSNQEVFGGNAVVLEYLEARGFALKHTERFKNIDVMTFVGPRRAAARVLAA